jgi:hypothetical protein
MCIPAPGLIIGTGSAEIGVNWLEQSRLRRIPMNLFAFKELKSLTVFIGLIA